MSYRSEKILRTGQIAGNPNSHPKYVPTRIETLTHDYGESLGSSQQNAMSRQDAENIVNGIPPANLMTIDGTLEQITKRVERTGHL